MQRAGRAVPGLLRDLERNEITLEAIEVHRPTLDDVFLTRTGRSLRDAEASTGEGESEDGARPGLPMPLPGREVDPASTSTTGRASGSTTTSGLTGADR